MIETAASQPFVLLELAPSVAIVCYCGRWAGAGRTAGAGGYCRTADEGGGRVAACSRQSARAGSKAPVQSSPVPMGPLVPAHPSVRCTAAPGVVSIFLHDGVGDTLGHTVALLLQHSRHLDVHTVCRAPAWPRGVFLESHSYATFQG